MRDRLVKLAGRRITDEGVLIIKADRHRTQERNREDARARLVELIREALSRAEAARRDQAESLCQGAPRRQQGATRRREEAAPVEVVRLIPTVEM